METKVAPANTKVTWPETKSDTDDSIGTLWRDFTQNTGFHGVNKLTPGRNYKFRCFWWTLAVMGMSTYMTYNIVNELMNFYSYPTVTSMKMEQVEEITFPAVTICNLSPLHRWKVMTVDPELEYFLNRTSLLGSFTGPIDWKKQFLGSTFRDSRDLEWWGSISINPDEIFDQCFMQGDHYKPCTKAMKLVVTSKGFCATFNYNSSDVRKVNLPGSEDNLNIFINTRQHDYVMGHESGVGVRVRLTFCFLLYEGFAQRLANKYMDHEFFSSNLHGRLDIIQFYFRRYRAKVNDNITLSLLVPVIAKRFQFRAKCKLPGIFAQVQFPVFNQYIEV